MLHVCYKLVRYLVKWDLRSLETLRLLSSTFTTFGMLQSRAIGSLNCVDPLWIQYLTTCVEAPVIFFLHTCDYWR